MTALKTLAEDSVYQDDDNGVINLKSNSIAIHRSDGVKHDLITVFNKSGISSVVEEAQQASKTSKKLDTFEDRGKISLNRSDGKHHDIGAVYRSQSEINVTASAKSKFWPFKPKISFTSTKGPSAPPSEKRPSLTMPKDAGYHPTSVRIVHMSDTFNNLKPGGKRSFLPDGDILVHSGNFTINGSDDEFSLFDSWLSSVKDIYHYRVICLGHRDVKRFGTEYDVLKALLPNATHVLCHEEATILGIRFYVAPWHWGYRFNYSLRMTAPETSNARLKDIPNNIDVLVTHGPALGRLDRSTEGEQLGSPELADVLKTAKPTVHLHGHVTEARGYIPAYGHAPLTLNSAMCERTRTVMYECPHVIKCTQIFDSVDPTRDSKSSPSMKPTTWEFAIDSLC